MFSLLFMYVFHNVNSESLVSVSKLLLEFEKPVTFDKLLKQEETV